MYAAFQFTQHAHTSNGVHARSKYFGLLSSTLARTSLPERDRERPKRKMKAISLEELKLSESEA
eukprot:6186459-Pleurochrysis_carterae.AAC.3